VNTFKHACAMGLDSASGGPRILKDEFEKMNAQLLKSRHPEEVDFRPSYRLAEQDSRYCDAALHTRNDFEKTKCCPHSATIDRTQKFARCSAQTAKSLTY
jgi:hypothetical protein